MTHDEELLTIDDVARLTEAPAKFVVQALDPDGIKPVNRGRWLERHKEPNLRWRRADIEGWMRANSPPSTPN